ncbi:MAG TPA: DUF423 domain-containing protein [Caulobacteraceae bacterium]|jgi:uncharacterized membrane protein YgdD (TMEM256/DUF423 family)
MSSLGRTCLVLAALSGGVAVIAGAYAAHGPLVAGPRQWIATGAHFELTHALAVFACVFVASLGAHRALWAAVLFLIGAALFSGSLYALALGAPKLIGLATPVGGLALIAGWFVLAWACASLKKPA